MEYEYAFSVEIPFPSHMYLSIIIISSNTPQYMCNILPFFFDSLNTHVDAPTQNSLLYCHQSHDRFVSRSKHCKFRSMCTYSFRQT